MGKKRQPGPVATHHIVPVSRGGNGRDSNLARVKRRDHEIYHMLFDSKKPNEIIAYLVETFWNNQWHWVYQCLLRDERRLPDEEVMQEVRTEN